jgi:hypothetical protein
MNEKSHRMYSIYTFRLHIYLLISSIYVSTSIKSYTKKKEKKEKPCSFHPLSLSLTFFRSI